MWDFAAVHAVTIGGRVLATGLFSNLAGDAVVLVRDAVTGALLGSEPVADDWVFTTPHHHLSIARVDESVYAVVLGKRSAYAVYRLAPDGPTRVDWFVPDASYVAGVTIGRIDRRPVVFTWDEDTVGAYGLLTGDLVSRVWTAPAGWLVDAVVRAGRRMYAWLVHDDDRCWLWDAAAGAAVRPPVRIRGLRWGPWDLAGRPALLRLVRGQRYEVWDLALGELVGPALPAPPYELGAPAVGTLYGRRVLAAVTDRRARVWDLLTGDVALDRELSPTPLALAVGDGGLTVVDRRAMVKRVRVPQRAVHPLAARHGLPPRPAASR